jgi:hypothetical protein
METPDRPGKAGPDAKPKTADSAPKAEDFLPRGGSLKEQVEQQIAFLTQAVTESAVLASGLFDIPEAEAPNVLLTRARPYQRQTRVIELDIMAKMARASAGLLHGLAHSQRYFEPHFVFDHTIRTAPGGKPAGTVTRVIARLPNKEGGGNAAFGKKEENGGSNG